MPRLIDLKIVLHTRLYSYKYVIPSTKSVTIPQNAIPDSSDRNKK